jgi:hypothetical protein
MTRAEALYQRVCMMAETELPRTDREFLCLDLRSLANVLERDGYYLRAELVRRAENLLRSPDAS